jgi:hypothetical protein
VAEYLSHYTTRAGLEGMAASKAFWATNFLDVNDTSEFLYAWTIVMRDAAALALEKVPSEMKRPDYDMDEEARRLAITNLDMVGKGDGYGHLYMTSFARAANEDQNKRGILTLWDRYTKHEGYCLQFARGDIEHLMQLDSWRSNYGWLGLNNVSYGVNKYTHTYRELRYQLAQAIILQMLRARGDIKIEPDWTKMWADSYLVRQLMNFCATHKDPCYEDEREVRIFGYPAEQAEARVCTGIAMRKPIRSTPNGKRYIVFGEHWTPGIVPRRIIIGTKANPDIRNVLAMYDGTPQVALAALPVA